jgi:hypothetical protein
MIATKKIRRMHSCRGVGEAQEAIGALSRVVFENRDSHE